MEHYILKCCLSLDHAFCLIWSPW